MGSRRRRSSVAALLLALVATTVPGGPASAVQTDESYWIPVGKQIVLNGHGYGHGHGMSQYGAQGAALRGLSYKEIVNFYYPGTAWGTVRGKVRVLLTADTSDDVVVSPADGLTVRDLRSGTTHELPVNASISRWRLVVRSGQTVVQHYTDRWRRLRQAWVGQIQGDAEFSARTPITLWTPAGQRAYRGTLRSASPREGSAARDTVNVVWMDEYVMGVVPYEMPASWHAEAVKSQAIAARTYATWSRSQNARRYYQICDTTACQVYGGVSSEDPRSNSAVRATGRQILTYGGRPAFTQFSASSGGWTSAGSVPYLRAQADPYDGWDGNYVHSWTRTVDASALERSYPAIGALRRIRITSRDGNGEWRGRVNTLVLDGTEGQVTISGDSMRWMFGLRSNWFTIEPTPIISRWARLGGPRSRLGDVRDREYPAAEGAVQRFEGGRVYYVRRAGARDLYGKILGTYVRVGGPQSELGFPRTTVRPRTGGYLARFEGGSIYRHGRGTPTVVSGAIDARFVAIGGLGSRLGWPTRGNYRVQGGQRADFEHGYIRWITRSRSTRVVVTD